MVVTSLHIHSTPPHLVEASYACRGVKGALGRSDWIRMQLVAYGFPRRPLLGDWVNRRKNTGRTPHTEPGPRISSV
jgi:hypothetical protein